MKLKLFLNYYWSVIINPSAAFEKLKEDKNSIRYSLAAVSITATLYTFVYIFLILGDGKPFKPFLNIPLENYYKYNVFFCAPSMFLGWILAVGVVHVLSRSITNTGSFEQILSIFGFGISIASWTTGVHDLLTSFLGAVHIIDQSKFELALNSPTIWRTILWILMFLYLIWFLVLFSKGIKAVYSMKNGPSSILGLVGFIIYQLFFIIFNR